MEKNEYDQICSSNEHKSSQDYYDVAHLQKLEQETNWDGRPLFQYAGFWSPLLPLQAIISAQKHFKAKDNDIVITSKPKSGTTWLIALVFSISNRNLFPIDKSPILTSHPHNLVSFLEYNLYLHQENPNLEHLLDPRIITTHMPFHALPDSIRASGCKIVYICRYPLDQFISNRHFAIENKFQEVATPLGLDESFEKFCRGISPFGPFWDHILGFWKAHLENPEKVLFLKYEEMKEDIAGHVRKIAEFLGFPFSAEEEEQGLVEEICKICSFQNLKSLEVNKHGKIQGFMKNSSFFRKGEVGDSLNHFSHDTIAHFDEIVESKFHGSGLSFKCCNSTSQ